MKRIAVLSFVGSLLLGTAVAQTSATSQTNVSAPQNTSLSAGKSSAQMDSQTSANAAQSADVSNKGAAASELKTGSSIHTTLDKPVDARKNKPGDQVVATTTEDEKSEGQVVIPRGSKIIGHVTEVKARERGQAESALGVVFDHAVLKDGSQVPLSLTVQAVGSGARAAQAEDDSLMSSGNAAATGSASGAGSSMTRTGGGLVGGVRSTTGGLVKTAGSVGGATLNPAMGAGDSSSLNSNSQGVVGLRGLNLASSTASSNSGTFTSKNSNVHLDSGTQMILRIQK
jgi:hypothetical protein